jgi:putative hydroxymethylpyrimidine transport system permease protein
MPLLRIAFIGIGLVLLWQATVFITRVPQYILPSPVAVGNALLEHGPELLHHAGITLIEILSGLIIGTLFGVGSALSMMISRRIKHWLMPVLVISQAIPVFALAPILVLWIGYGLGSKIAMAVLIIFFPVTAAFYDGLRRTEPQWLELAQVMDAPPYAILRQIQIPAALPAFASGLRVAAAVAPIGAIVGEWVGSSAGLGFYMLHANARMQIDMMFAALSLLAGMALSLYFIIDAGLRRLVFWQAES